MSKSLPRQLISRFGKEYLWFIDHEGSRIADGTATTIQECHAHGFAALKAAGFEQHMESVIHRIVSGVPDNCLHCAKPITQPVSRGRPRLYCDPVCRQRAHRGRAA